MCNYVLLPYIYNRLQGEIWMREGLFSDTAQENPNVRRCVLVCAHKLIIHLFTVNWSFGL